MEIAVGLCAWFLLCIVIAKWADSWGRSEITYFFGSLLCSPLLGALALLIEGRNSKKIEEKALGADSKKCPFCAELIRKEATKCRYCGSDLTAVVSPPSSAPIVPEAVSAPQAPALPRASQPPASPTWRLILDRRVATERDDVVRDALIGLRVFPTTDPVNVREVIVAAGLTLTQVNGAMARLHGAGVPSRKEQDPTMRA